MKPYPKFEPPDEPTPPPVEGKPKADNSRVKLDFSKLCRPLTYSERTNPHEKLGGLFPRASISVIYGQSGDGKSILTQRFFQDMARGGTVLDGFYEQDTPLKCLLIAGEAGRLMYSVRRHAFGWECSENFLIVDQFETVAKSGGCGFDIAKNEGRQNLIDLLDHAQPDIIALDSLFSFASFNENDSEQLNDALQFLLRQAIQRNMAVLLVHHRRKRANKEQKGDIFQDEASGSSFLQRIASVMFTVQSAKDDFTTEKTFAVKSTKMREGRELDPFTFQLLKNEAGHSVMSVNLSPELKEKGNCREDTLTLIASEYGDGSEFSRADVEALSSYSESAVGGALAHLVEQRKLNKAGKGKTTRYSLVLTPVEKLNAFVAERRDLFS